MSDVEETASSAGAVERSSNWRWWLVRGCVSVMFLLLLWLRTTDYTGVEAAKVGVEVVYRMSPWVMPLFVLPVLVCLAFTVALVTLPSKLMRLFAAIPFFAAVAVLAVLPTVLTSRMVVSPAGFEHKTGFWWEPVTKVIRFADLESITFEPVEREGQKPSFKLTCRAKDGEEVEIQKSTLLEAGLLNIFGKALKAGVKVEGWIDAEDEDAGAEN